MSKDANDTEKKVAVAIYKALKRSRGEPFVSGHPLNEDGELTLIDGSFDLIKIARRVIKIISGSTK